MKKLALLLSVLCLINADKCPKSGNKPPSNNPTNNTPVGEWSQWQSISSFPLQARFRRMDDLGGGNFAWQIQFRNNDLVMLKFSYKVAIKKGDGTGEVIERPASMSPGVADAQGVSAASIVSVHASNVKQGP